MSRLLLIDNDPFMQRTLQKVFAAEGYYCAIAPDAEEARRELEVGSFDLVVLHLWRIISRVSTMCSHERRHKNAYRHSFVFGDAFGLPAKSAGAKPAQ